MKKSNRITNISLQKAKLIKKLLWNKYVVECNNNNNNNNIEQPTVNNGSSTIPSNFYHSQYRKLILSKLTIKDFDILSNITSSCGKIYIVQEKLTRQIYSLKVLNKVELTYLSNKNLFPQKNSNGNNRIIFVKDMPTLSLKQKQIGATPSWILNLICCFQDEFYFYFVMEHPEGGNLAQWQNFTGKFTEAEAKFYLAELALAVDYVHNHLFCPHRDIKPQNILLDGKGHLKISDPAIHGEIFLPQYEDYPPIIGTLLQNDSRFLMTDEDQIFHMEDVSEDMLDYVSSNEKIKIWNNTKEKLAAYGSPIYSSPEVLKRQEPSLESDWFSFGIISFELLCGFHPFLSNSVEGICKKIVKGSWRLQNDIELSSAALDLLKKLLCEDPMSRIVGLSQLKQHPFFNGVDWDHITGQVTPFRYADVGSSSFHSNNNNNNNNSGVLTEGQLDSDDSLDHINFNRLNLTPTKKKNKASLDNSDVKRNQISFRKTPEKKDKKSLTEIFQN